MGYRTTNIDRIARRGDLYRRLRAAELHGRAGGVRHRPVPDPHRPAEGRPPGRFGGSLRQGPDDRQPAQGAGLRDGQFGKNHLGDRNEFIPTVHGFDEFFGNFYHLNAEEEPENRDYPKDPKFREMFGPRGVFHCYATDTVSTLAEDRRSGMGQAALRGHRPAARRSGWRRWTRRCSPRPSSSSTRGSRRQALVRLVQHDPDAHPHPPQGGVAGQDRARSRPGRDGRARRPHRPALEEAGRPGCRREHDRDLDDRQRRRGLQLARRGHDGFAARRTPTGRAAIACRWSCAGPA